MVFLYVCSIELFNFEMNVIFLNVYYWIYNGVFRSGVILEVFVLIGNEKIVYMK